MPPRYIETAGAAILLSIALVTFVAGLAIGGMSLAGPVACGKCGANRSR
jgi:hypothetical protein